MLLSLGTESTWLCLQKDHVCRGRKHSDVWVKTKSILFLEIVLADNSATTPSRNLMPEDVGSEATGGCWGGGAVCSRK